MESFWDTTWRAFNVALAAFNDTCTDEHNHGLSIAWHVAALSHQKKLPTLKSIMVKKQRPQRRLTAEETDRFLINLAKAQGGKIIYLEKK